MSVGTGSIKRAAAKVTETPKTEEQKVTANVIANPSTEVVEKIVGKTAEKTTKKPAARKTTAKKATKLEETATVVSEEEKAVSRNTNEACQLTQEMPIYLL